MLLPASIINDLQPTVQIVTDSTEVRRLGYGMFLPAGLFRHNIVRHGARRLMRCAALWLALLAAVSAFADDSRISPDLLPLISNPNNRVNVIAQYNTTPQQSTT